MENKYNICSNIISKEKTLNIAEVTLEAMKNSVALSLGPYGAKAIIEGTALDHKMTKDGYTILKNIRFNNNIANAFLEMYRDASLELVSSVGDGSTTTIIAAYYLYVQLKELLESEQLRPIEVIDASKKAVDKLSKYIKDMAIKITPDDEKLRDIASVSLNNNKELGTLIWEIYKKIGKDGFIFTKIDNSRKTDYEYNKGFVINAGYMDKTLINSENNESKLSNTLVLLFDGFISDRKYIKFILDVFDLINNGLVNYKSLVVIAEDYSKEFKKTLMNIDKRYESSNIKKNYNFISNRILTDFENETFYDLSAVTNSKIIKVKSDQDIIDDEILETINDQITENGYPIDLNDEKQKEKLKSLIDTTPKYLRLAHKLALQQFAGYSKEVVSTKRTTTFLEPNENIDLKNKIIEDIHCEQENMKKENINNPKRSYELDKRLAVLNNNLITLYVGGDSEQERIAQKDLIADAIAACKSALEYGYVPGCDLSILMSYKKISNTKVTDKSSDSELENKILDRINNAFIEVYKEVLKNAPLTTNTNNIIDVSINKGQVYDLTKLDFDDQSTIINSAETEIKILENVVSIIIMILTSNQYLTYNANESLLGIDNTEE